MASPMSRQGALTVRRFSKAASPVTMHLRREAAAPAQQTRTRGLSAPGAFKPIVERTTWVVSETLRRVPQLRPGEKQAEPDSFLPLRELPNPAGRARAVVCFGIEPGEVTQFARESNQLFDTARDVLDFSGERVLVVPPEITAQAKPLPLTHTMAAEDIARDFGAHGLTVTDEGVQLQGLDYLMQLRPLHRVDGRWTSGWSGQQAHFHQGEEGAFHDQRLLHGVVPRDVTVVLFHTHGAEVAPGESFVAIRIDPSAGHQFSTIHDLLLQLDPPLRQRLRTPGPLEPEWLSRLQGFMMRHKVIPGVEFDSLTQADLAAASALLLSSHTKDPPLTGADGENIMADLTRGILQPERFGTFLPWEG